MFFGSNIKYLRTVKGMTQAELAAAMGVTTPTVTGWESGKSYPHFQVLLQLRQLFGVDLERLVYQDLQNAAAEDPQRGGSAVLREVEELKRRMDALEGRMAKVEEN